MINKAFVKSTEDNDDNLRTGTDAANTDPPYLNNNAHFLFSECIVSDNDAHKAFTETDSLSEKTAENTWLVCQGYHYEDELAKIDGTDGRLNDVAARKVLVDNSKENSSIGKPVSDILICDKNLLSGFI